MNPQLKYFIHASLLRPLNRLILTRFLEDLKHSLSPEAAGLLAADLDHEQFCAAWAAQFRSPSALGAPLLEALSAIETLAIPENRPLLQDALSHLPRGYEVNQNLPPLHQALHLWVIAQNTPGVTYPLPSGENQSKIETAPLPATESTPHPALDTPHSEGPLLPPLPPVQTPDPNGEPLSGSDDHQLPLENSDQSKINTVSPPATESTPHSEASLFPPLPPVQNPGSNCQPETDQQAFARLARLPTTDYDRCRRAEAKRLHLRLATLDDAVGCARILEDDAQANAVVLPQLQPWPEPILDAPALFDQVHDRYLLYLYLPAGAPVVFTLWTPHAHAIGAFTQTPRLNLTSIEPGCGKTTALNLMATMTPNVLRTDNLKPAVLFRIVHLHQPTLLLDELDAYLHLYPELRGLLNAGNDPGACVYRCEGHIVRSFKAFAATALAGIGHLAPTLRDRSIIIPFVKAPPGSLQARFDKRHTKTETILGRKIARWTQDNFAAIAACDPVMPPAAYNRLGDNWRPLFALAQIIGGHWPQRVLDAFHALSSSPSSPASSSSFSSSSSSSSGPSLHLPQSAGSQLSTLNHQLPATPIHQSTNPLIQVLLADIRHLFTQSAADRLFSSTLVSSLCALPNRPWSLPPLGTHSRDCLKRF
ncbi:MAG TPA: DUF3631 domain-containing protein [Candidatus Acidoferrum sp.]|nr:DUF3631 domain-containing protein [Candidatus Acidoferrum sp.]